MKRILVSLALLTALLAAHVAPASQSGPAQASRAKTVDVSNFEFSPRNLETSKGTRVVFSNSSGAAHTATGKGAFDTGRIKAGRSVSVRFEQRGTFKYHCEIHPFMRGKVVVD